MSQQICNNCPYDIEVYCSKRNIPKCNVTREELQEQLIQAIRELYEKDYYLIEKGLYETCVVAHILRYFTNKYFQDYSEYSIDMEYSKNGNSPKNYLPPGEQYTNRREMPLARPDMIIHNRGCNYHNFVYIEFKGWWNNRNSGQYDDENKLKIFTDQNDSSEFAYKFVYGISIKLNKKGVRFKWFKDGEYIPEWDYSPRMI